MSNPPNDLGMQIPGRLIAIEVLLTHLLRQNSSARKLLDEAMSTINTMEGTVIRKSSGATSAYQIAVFKVARASLRNIAGDIQG